MSTPKTSQEKIGAFRRFRWLIIGLIIVGLVAAGLFFLPFSPFNIHKSAEEAARDTQYQALLALEAASESTPTIYYQNGFPRFVDAMVPVSGENSVERAQNFLDTYADLYLQGNSDFALQVRRLDGENDENVVFYQTYRGLPVYTAEIVVSLEDDKVFATIGGLMTKTVLDINPVITANEAEVVARADLGLVAETPVSAITRLEIYDQSVFDEVTPDPHLVWHVFFGGEQPWDVFVDAYTGQVIAKIYNAEGSFDLDLEHANGSWATDGNACYRLTYADDFIADEEDFDSEYNSDAEAVAMWYYASRVYNFFNSTFGLDSYDGDGEDIEIYIHAGGPVITGGAHYSPGCDIFEFSNGWVGVDIVGHEYTHAVIEFSSDLVYSNQPGALNESYADVFGSFLDGNWLIGDNRVGGGGPIRDMSNPSAHNQPDTMPPRSISTDNGGVHTNSGIPNKAAYLIAAGGTHNGFTITGIGRGKMGILLYTAMRSIPSGAQFIDARNRAVSWADAWARSGAHGFTRQDACTVRNAYAAVGLGDPDLNCDGVEETDPDRDRDGVLDSRDNCLTIFNPDQRDSEGDRYGDICDDDDDNDSIPDTRDNCRLVANSDQQDTDHNGTGDACQDTDHDTLIDVNDNCPRHFNPRQEDMDRDGVGDICDPDMEGDGLPDKNDNCPRVSNPGQDDKDHDGVGDACDNCNLDPNQDQKDVNGNGVGDACDPDADSDGIPNGDDNCPLVRNPDQADLDGNGEGAACDLAESRILSPEVMQAFLRGNPGNILRIPIPPLACPNCPSTTWYPQDLCYSLAIQNIPPQVFSVITNDEGRVVAHGASDDLAQTFLRYHPIGGRSYFLNFILGLDFDASQPVSVGLSLSLVTCPRPVIPEIQPAVAPLALKAGGSPNPVYYGQCTQNEPTAINFEAFAEGDTSKMARLVIWYTYFDAKAVPIMGDFIEMAPISGGAYAASLDVNQNASYALSNGAGTIQFHAQAQDSSGGVLAQSDGSQITVYPCMPFGVTVVPPEEPPTPTPWPTKTPPGPVDYDGDGYYPPDDCDDYNAEINPGAQEEDNGLDENCNGKVDEGFDQDGDGYTPIYGGDCNDNDPTIHPGAPETPKDGVDSNCNGDDDAFVSPPWPEVAMPASPPPIPGRPRPQVI